MQNAIVKCTDRLILWICVPHTAAACGNVCFSTSSISGIVRAAVGENITTTATTKWLSGFCLNSVRKRCMCLSETECVHHDATQLRTIHPSITLAYNIVSFTHLLHTISILLIHRSFYRVCMAMLVARTLFARLLLELRSRACFFFVGRCCCCCCAYVSDMCVFGSQLYANANETHAHIKCCMHTFITQSNRMLFVQLLVVCCLLLQAVVTGASFSHHLNEGWVSAMWRGHQCCNVQRKYSGC